MMPTIGIYDDFFDDADSVRKSIVAGVFENIVSPVDGVTYPDIQVKLSNAVLSQFLESIERAIHYEVHPTVVFARLTKSGVKAPHKIHSDAIMGEYSAHAYLSGLWPKGSGTSFWGHPTEGDCHSETTDIARVQQDQNEPERWEMRLLVPARFNRALIHDARLWHCAEPIGGFGEDASSGRLVLTAFFHIGGPKK